MKAAIFDMGGVVVSPKTLAPFKRDFAKRLGVSYKKFRKVFGIWFNKWKLGKITEDEAWRGILKDLNRDYDIAYFKKAIRKQRIFKGVAEFIRNLRKKGIKTALLSNTCREWFELNRKRFYFGSLFDVMVVSFEEGVAKPDRKIYRTAAKKLGVKPEECVFVDDKLRNVEVADELGMEGIVYTSLEDLVQRFKNVR